MTVKPLFFVCAAIFIVATSTPVNSRDNGTAENANTAGATDSTDSTDIAENEWESAILAFERWDSMNSFPADAVLFTGGSCVTHWRSRETFPRMPVINRGIDRACINDIISCAKRLILPYKPRVIVVAAGEHDLIQGRTADQVAEDMLALVTFIKNTLPASRVIVLSIKPSEKHLSLWPMTCQANAFIEQICDKDDSLFFVDVAGAMLDGSGKPNRSLYTPDGFELNAAGYKTWAMMLRPLLAMAILPARSPANDVGMSRSGVSPQSGAAYRTSYAPALYYVASKGSKIFHKSTCRSAKRITAKNRVRFDSRQQAEATGRQPCKVCNP